ncbi:MAG: hypothetical protein U9R49_15460, partial [Bacteroidota bacterium]|nr:hypothetical protein [Bacteroidota bacterium]
DFADSQVALFSFGEQKEGDGIILLLEEMKIPCSPLESLSQKILEEVDILILLWTPKPEDDLATVRKVVRNYAERGGRVLLIYPGGDFGSEAVLFSEIVEGFKTTDDSLIKPVPGYSVTQGIEPFDVGVGGQIELLRCPDGTPSYGTVVLRNGNRLNSAILSDIDAGKVLILGFLPPEAGKKVLENGLLWLASEETIAMEMFYKEARSLPSLSPVPSRITEMENPEGKELLAGAAKIDITPEGSVNIFGFSPRNSTGVHDRQYVRALVLDNGKDKLAIISWDILHFSDFPAIKAIREEIFSKTGIPEENILINATHTHSAMESVWHDESVDAVVEAINNMQAARIGVGSKFIYEIGANRRWPGGKWINGPLDYNPDGIMDNECGVIRVEDYDRNIIAVVVNYSSHPTVLGGSNTLLSGDYAGIGMNELERDIGEGAIALFLQGCAGDAGTQGFRTARSIPEAERLGRLLADEVSGIMEYTDVIPWVPLKAKNKMVDLPAKSGDPITNEMQGLVIGDNIIVTLGSMEPYIELGLEVKENSPFSHTFVLGYSNGPWLHYLPSNRAYEINDPDVQTTEYNFEAPDVAVNEALQLIQELAPPN